jgi:hypothetical protein
MASKLCKDAPTGDASQYDSALRRAQHRRTLFATEQGYLGLGPIDVEVGDCVCVLFGVLCLSFYV